VGNNRKKNTSTSITCRCHTTRTNQNCSIYCRYYITHIYTR